MTTRSDGSGGWRSTRSTTPIGDTNARIGRCAGWHRRQTTVAEPVEPDEFGRLLAALPTQQRAATALFYVDGLSIAEIAVALDIAEGSVKSHLHDARQRLKPLLEGERR